jgi:hypothetical protein
MPYCPYEFVTQTIMLHFLTETCISCGCNSVGVHNPQIYDMERENTKSGLKLWMSVVFLFVFFVLPYFV